MNGDNFEYVNQLAKGVSDQARSTRLETDKIELLLKRVAKQSTISYDQLSQEVNDETQRRYEENISQKDEIQRLIEENYKLIYEIEQEEYMNGKFMSMIENVNIQLESIKSYIIEIKLTREQDLDNFLYENVHSKNKIVDSSCHDLKLKKEASERRILESVITKFRDTYRCLKREMEESKGYGHLRNDSGDILDTIEHKINEVEGRYNIELR